MTRASAPYGRAKASAFRLVLVCLGFRVRGLKGLGLGLRVQGLGFRVQTGFGVEGCRLSGVRFQSLGWD